MFLDTQTIVEVTLQPVKRYSLDASILFSDILIIPYLMGSQISFGENSGPLVEFDKSSKVDIKKAEPIYNAIKQIRDTSYLLYTSPSPRDRTRSRMPSSA